MQTIKNDKKYFFKKKGLDDKKYLKIIRNLKKCFFKKKKKLIANKYPNKYRLLFYFCKFIPPLFNLMQIPANIPY